MYNEHYSLTFKQKITQTGWPAVKIHFDICIQIRYGFKTISQFLAELFLAFFDSFSNNVAPTAVCNQFLTALFGDVLVV